MSATDANAVAYRVARLTSQRNRQKLFEAGIEGGLGLIVTAVIFGVIYWITYLICIFGVSDLVGLSPERIALGTTLIFAIVSIASALREVNPLEGVSAMTPGQEFTMYASWALDGAMVASPRHVVSGASYVLIGGPVAVCNAIRGFRDQLPKGHSVFQDAGDILVRMDPSLRVDDVTNHNAVLLLRRLMLIKAARIGRDAELNLERTERGHNVVRGTSAP